MKIITITTYDFAELSADAQDKAVEQVAQKLGSDWWDWSDDDAIREVIVYKLAEELLTPGWNTFGCGDFPGIPNFKIVSYDLGRAASIEVDGTLTIDNAPALPWPDDCDRFRLGHTQIRYTGNHRGLWIADSYPEWPADDDRDDVVALYCKWDEAVAAAVAAGRAELEYKSGPEYARDWLEANGGGSMFFENGELAS